MLNNILKLNIERIYRFYNFKEYYKEHKFKLQGIAFFKILSVVITLVSPIVYSCFIQNVLIEKKFYVIYYVFVAYIAIFLFESLCRFGELNLFNKLNNNLTEKLKSELVYKLFLIDKKVLQTKSSGDISNTILYDANNIINVVVEDLIEYFINYIFMIVNMLIMFSVNGIFAILCFLSIIISFFVTKKIGEKTYIINKKYRELYGNYENYCYNRISNWKEIKMGNLYEYENNRFINISKKLNHFYFKKQMYSFFNKAFNMFKDEFIIKINIYLIAGFMILNSEMEIVTLFLFIKYFENLYSYLQKVIDNKLNFKNRKVSLDKINEIIKSKERNSEGRELSNYDWIINGMTCKYNNKIIFKDLNFKISYGEHIAICGPSGCGKSTLIKKMLKYDAEIQENILLGNYPLYEISDEFFINDIGVIMQEPVFFNLSLRDNLMLAAEDVTDEKIKSICKNIGFHEEIMMLEDGYNTILGENASHLSGGQRQILAVVRLLLSNYKIVFLDEITSAMDTKREEKIMNFINEYFSGNTVIAISHKENTINKMERRIYLNQM